jgi:hypothetical protein
MPRIRRPANKLFCMSGRMMPLELVYKADAQRCNCVGFNDHCLAHAHSCLGSANNFQACSGMLDQTANQWMTVLRLLCLYAVLPGSPGRGLCLHKHESGKMKSKALLY